MSQYSSGMSLANFIRKLILKDKKYFKKHFFVFCVVCFAVHFAFMLSIYSQLNSFGEQGGFNYDSQLQFLVLFGKRALGNSRSRGNWPHHIHRIAERGTNLMR